MDGGSDACWEEVYCGILLPAARILNAAARELLGVVIMGWGAVCACVADRSLMQQNTERQTGGRRQSGRHTKKDGMLQSVNRPIKAGGTERQTRDP